MSSKKITMLDKSIKMNLKISEKYAFREVGWLVFAVFLMDIFTIPALVMAAIYVFLAFRELFDKSLFGEEAYSYMTVPMSMKHIIIGKAIAANLWLMLSYMMIVVTLIVSALLLDAFDLDWSVGASMLQAISGVFDAAEDGAISEGEIVYDRISLMHMSVNMVITPVRLMADSIFLCAMFQFAAVVRHVADPQRRKPVITAMAAFGGIAAFCLVWVFIFKIDHFIFGDDITVWSAILEMVICGGCGIALLAASIKLLDRKYNLY